MFGGAGFGRGHQGLSSKSLLKGPLSFLQPSLRFFFLKYICIKKRYERISEYIHIRTNNMNEYVMWSTFVMWSNDKLLRIKCGAKLLNMWSNFAPHEQICSTDMRQCLLRLWQISCMYVQGVKNKWKCDIERMELFPFEIFRDEATLSI